LSPAARWLLVASIVALVALCSSSLVDVLLFLSCTYKIIIPPPQGRINIARECSLMLCCVPVNSKGASWLKAAASSNELEILLLLSWWRVSFRDSLICSTIFSFLPHLVVALVLIECGVTSALPVPSAVTALVIEINFRESFENSQNR
jgi:hypothetical protein